MTKVYDNATDLITFARLQSQNTTSGSSYLGSDGLLKFAAEDEPRIEYGSDGALKGLLIEEQRTNLLTYSEDFSESAWSENFSEFTMDAVGPDRAPNSAGRLTDDISGGAGSAYTQVNVTVSTETTYTFSIFAKADQLSDIQLRCVDFTTPGTVGVYFDLSAGEVGNATGSGVTGEIEDFGSGWYRCSITFTTDVTDTYGRIRVHLANGESLSISRDGTSSVLFYGAQLEEGSFATSYIPTSGSQQTRSADVASIPVSAFGYNQDAGTVVVEAQVADTSVSNAGDLRIKTATGSVITNSGSRVGGFPAGSYVVYSPTTNILMRVDTVLGDGQPYKAAYSIAESDSAISVNGSSVVIDQTTTLAGNTVSLFELGNNFGFLNGHIKSLKYYPRRLTNAQLQELTA